MCQNNCSIIEVENKEEREINSRLTYEDRIKIEEKLRSRKKITITQIANELGRNKSIISREINTNEDKTAMKIDLYNGLIQNAFLDCGTWWNLKKLKIYDIINV